MTCEEAYKILDEHGMKCMTVEYFVKENGKIVQAQMTAPFIVKNEDVDKFKESVRPLTDAVGEKMNELHKFRNPFPKHKQK